MSILHLNGFLNNIAFPRLTVHNKSKAGDDLYCFCPVPYTSIPFSSVLMHRIAQDGLRGKNYNKRILIFQLAISQQLSPQSLAHHNGICAFASFAPLYDNATGLSCLFPLFPSQHTPSQCASFNRLAVIPAFVSDSCKSLMSYYVLYCCPSLNSPFLFFQFVSHSDFPAHVPRDNVWD